MMQFTSLWEGVDAYGCHGYTKGSTSNRAASQENLALWKNHKKMYKRVQVYQPTVGEDLQIVQQDHLVKTHPANNHNRRTLVLKKDSGAWGFTIQTYGLQHQTHSEVEDLTYVDYVEMGSPAFMAGLRKGDIILSVNGTTTDNISHETLAGIIRQCSQTMRMVVLFEDCSRKVELHLRYMKLKKLLAAKEFELNSINDKLSRLQNKSSVNQSGASAGVMSSSASCQDLRWQRLSLSPAQTENRPASYCGNTAKKSSTEGEARPVSVTGVSSGASSDTSVDNLFHSLPRPAKKLPKSEEPKDLPASFAVGAPNQFCSLPLSRSNKKSKRPQTLKIATPKFSLTPSPQNPDSSDSENVFSRSLRSRTSSRSRSLRGSFRLTLSPGSAERCEKSSNHVLTEENSRVDTDPTLLRLKLGSLELTSSQPQRDGPGKLKRSLSTPHVNKLSLPRSHLAKRSDSDSGRSDSGKSESPKTIPQITYTDCDVEQKPKNNVCKPTFCSDTNCNNVCVGDANVMVNGACDSNGNHFQLGVPTTRRSKSSENILRSASKDSDKLTRPWSTGSDLTKLSRSRSSGSSSSVLSTPSSGGYEFYTDPFTPSPNESTNQDFPFPQRPNETPVLKPLKKVTKRMLTYSRHKDIVRQELRLVNINEEEEVTRL